MRTVKAGGINAVMLDFTPRIDRHDAREYAVSECFWYNSPTPNFQGSLNIGFWLIFILIFVGLAMQSSGARMSRQSRFLRERGRSVDSGKAKRRGRANA